MHIDASRLNHFLAAVDAGSILGAAERVHLSQPALSRSIRALEESIGVTLLERHARGVRPTPYGEVLVRHARLLQNQARIALSEIEALRQGHDGHLRVGIAPSFHRLLPAAMVRLLGARPGLTFDVVEGTYDVVAEGVLEGDLDAAFTMFPAGESHEGLVLRPLIQSHFAVVMSAEHALARRRALRLSDLVETSWVMIFRPPSLVGRVREVFLESGVPPPARCVETDSIPLVKELLRSGAFVSVLPREIVHDEVRAGQFVAKRIAARTGSATAGVITRAGAVLPAALDALIAVVEEERKRMRLRGPQGRSAIAAPRSDL
jgi:DNA-binding transcriptional LysR family regulator